MLTDDKTLNAKIDMVNRYLNMLLRDRHQVTLTDILRVVSVEMRAKVDIVSDYVRYGADHIMGQEVVFIQVRKVA